MLKRLFGLLLVCASLVGCMHRPPRERPPIPEVTVSVPIRKTVTDYEDFIGRLDSVNYVEIKARVTGYLTKVYFTDGGQVKEGDPLYEIDPTLYQTELDRARGTVLKLLGQKALIEILIKRYKGLVAKGAASQQELDLQIGQLAENVGALAAAESQVRYATDYVKFCTVRSPITGQVSRTSYTVGNLINADQTALTTVVSIDPIWAYFNVEEATYLRIQAMAAAGVYKDPFGVEVRMGLADDVHRRFPYEGKLNFVNNQVSPQTGTILIRGEFANPKRLFKPGLFARVRAPIGPPHPVLLVTEVALNSDQGQKFVYVVDAENKVHYRRVKVGLTFDGLRAIEEGLKPDERVIVNGLQRVRPGIEVHVKTVDMEQLREGITHRKDTKKDNPMQPDR